MKVHDKVMINKVEWEKIFLYLAQNAPYSRDEIRRLDQIAFFTLEKQVREEVEAKIRQARAQERTASRRK